MEEFDHKFITETLKLADQAVQQGNRPFAAIIARFGSITTQTTDQVRALGDPTAHAEIESIRMFCRQFKRDWLSDAVIYSIVEPCPMCAGAIHYSGISRLVYSVSRTEFDRLVSTQRQRRPKTYQSCRPIITDSGSTEVVGPILEQQGLAVIRQYAFARGANLAIEE